MEKANDEECAAPFFEPRIPDFAQQYPKIETVSYEDGKEVVFLSESVKLYRRDFTTKEWKKRGVGTMRFLQVPEKGVWILMRRDSTSNVCASHFIWKTMLLNQDLKCPRAYIYTTLNDVTDAGTPEDLGRKAVLRVKFLGVSEAEKFKECFERYVSESTLPQYVGEVAYCNETEMCPPPPEEGEEEEEGRGGSIRHYDDADTEKMLGELWDVDAVLE